KIEIEARRRFMKVAEFVRAHYPGFQRAYILDAAPQVGVRQTRLLEGEYVVTKEDLLERRTFSDVVARGRDYYTPYRSLLPKGVEGLLAAGRCYAATPEAQRISREIPPVMVMGEAAWSARARLQRGGGSAAARRGAGEDGRSGGGGAGRRGGGGGCGGGVGRARRRGSAPSPARPGPAWAACQWDDHRSSRLWR